MRLREFGLLAAVSYAAMASSCGGDDPPVATSITVAPSAAVTLAAIGATQQLTPTVLDQHGNAMSGVVVNWTTNSPGTATVSPLGLVTAVANGTAIVTGTAGAAHLDVTTTVAQAVTSLTKTGDAQSGLVNGVLTNAISVRAGDAGGAAVVGVSITFAVTAGGGMLSSTTVTTNATGQASTFWTLGGSAGAQSMTATTGATVATFAATAVAAQAAIFIGEGQTGLVGYGTNIRPAVRVSGAANAPVPGVSVTFAVASGGGSITGGTTTTNANGVAQVGKWTLGNSPGANTLTATIATAAGSPITFNASAINSAYNITIQNVGPAFSPAVQAAFDSAVARWQRTIIGDVPDFTVNIPANACGVAHPAVSQTIDDMLIFARVDSIDGPGKILGQAGFCVYRNPGTLFPAIGIMTFDSADMAGLSANGQLRDVILHEMGHTLGFGTLWPTQLGVGFPGKACVSNVSSAGNALDTYFSCPLASLMFDSIGGTSYTGGNKVPVENCGPASPVGCGAGTYNSHWREPTFGAELMTGYLNSGVANPFSVLSVAAMGDLGYGVNYGAADAYTKVFTAPSPFFVPQAREILDDIWKGPLFAVSPTGVVQRVR